MMTRLERMLIGIQNAFEVLLPGRRDDWLERDYEAALAAVEAETEVHEPAKPKTTFWTSDWKRIANSLGVDERDAQWVAAHGKHWKWVDNRWWYQPAESATFWTPAPYDYWPSGDPPYTAVDPQAEAMDWQGWAVPAILEVLAEVGDVPALLTYDDWCERIAPKIADRIACDPQRAAEALARYVKIKQ